jgi:sulfonate transport system permease protein
MATDDSLTISPSRAGERNRPRGPVQRWHIAGLLLPFAFLGLMEILVRG